MPEKEVEECGLGNYVSIEQGLTDARPHSEASRCLRCDVCIGCGLCQLACSEMGVEALRMADTAAGRLAYFDFTRPATTVHRLRRLRPGLPDRRDPHRGRGRHAAHDHHRHGGVRTAVAASTPTRPCRRRRRRIATTSAGACRPHGGASGPRDQSVVGAAARRSPRRSTKAGIRIEEGGCPLGHDSRARVSAALHNSAKPRSLTRSQR